jgi:hypothetical protein
MGCDYSNFIKTHFAERIDSLADLKSKVTDKQRRIEDLLEDYSTETAIEIDIKTLSDKLSANIQKLESFKEELQKIKQYSTNDTSRNKSIKIFDKTDKTQQNNKEKPPNAETPHRKSPDHILQDPEIAALINKNRKKLMKKFTNDNFIY